MGVSQQIRIAMLKKNVSLNELAEKVGTTAQNLSGKFRRDNLSEKDMRDIAKALGCDLQIRLVDKVTGTQI